MFNRVEAKMLAQKQIKGNILNLFLISIITKAVLAMCIGILVVGWVAIFVVTPALMIGITMIYLNMAKGEKADVARMFDGFQNVGPCVLLYLLTGLFTFLWTLLFYVPGIIKYLSYSMGRYILAEHPNMTANEALNESKRMMHGHKGELFVLYLSFIGWALLIPFTLGILAIWLVPYINMTVTNFYNTIKPVVQIESTSNYGENSYYN